LPVAIVFSSALTSHRLGANHPLRNLRRRLFGPAAPRLDTIAPKLAAYFDNQDLAASTVYLQKTLIESAMTVVEPYLTFAPANLGVERYI
jgi:hypothetical protein